MPRMSEPSLIPVEVHKFGGAAVCDRAGLLRAASLMLARMKEARGKLCLVVVVSAMGKTTAALERAVRAVWDGDAVAATRELATVEQTHEAVLRAGAPAKARPAVEALLADLRRCLLEGAPAVVAATQAHTAVGTGSESEAMAADEDRRFDAHYDAVVAFGERLSSTLLVAVIEALGETREDPQTKTGPAPEARQGPVLLNALQLIRTNARHREALVDLDQTYALLRDAVARRAGTLCVLPGFIGVSPEGETTTLGLEGSDYTAALAAAALGAGSVTLWKNVPGVFQADPARFSQALPIPQLDFQEVFQMTNYGAKVIHPKTMQPLQQAGIPLQVRSFLDPAAAGTVIGPQPPEKPYPPITVVVEDLRWLRLRHQALAYMSERDIARIFALLREQRAKAYCTEIGRMTLSLGIWVDPRRWDALLASLRTHYAAEAESGLELVTVRHPARRDGQKGAMGMPEAEDRTRMYLEQRSGETYQCLRRPS